MGKQTEAVNGNRMMSMFSLYEELIRYGLVEYDFTTLRRYVDKMIV